MPPQLQVKPTLLDVRPDIIKRGKELFGPEGLDQKEADKVQDRYKGLPEFARPKGDTQSDALRQPGTLLDPLNVLGLRERTIDKIVEQGGQDLINSYDSQTGKYGALSGWNRTLDGVTDDDITKAILRRNERLRQSDPEFQENLAELERNGVKVDSLTSNLTIKDKAQNFKDIKTTKTAIRQMPEGAARLEALGDNPTLEQLEALQTELKPLTQESRAVESGIENVQSQIQNRQGTLELAQLQERNSNKISMAEIDFKNKTNEYNYLTANADRDYKYRAAEADRELKKELALLGFEDKAADRRYDREERRDQNRQLLIMQMMKGLQNFGSAFAL